MHVASMSRYENAGSALEERRSNVQVCGNQNCIYKTKQRSGFEINVLLLQKQVNQLFSLCPVVV